MNLRVLYYAEPKIGSSGGVNNVAYYLPKALNRKLSITCFPLFRFNKGYFTQLIDISTKLVKKDFDILHFNYVPVWRNGSTLLLELCHKVGRPIVLNIHGIIPLEYKLEEMERLPFFSLLAAMRSCKVANAIVVNSEYMKNKLATIYGINQNKIVVIPNGIDLSMFKQNKHKIALQGNPCILYLGGLFRIKGIDVLLQAITKLIYELPDLRLHLVGHGEISEYQKMAKGLGIEKFVVFHGKVSHNEVPLYFRSADFCVFPSRHEGFPLVVLEAMASGIPIIASNIPIFREVLNKGERGVLFETGSPTALSNSVITLCRDSELRNRILKAALGLVPNYSWEHISEKYISLYNHLCSL